MPQRWFRLAAAAGMAVNLAARGAEDWILGWEGLHRLDQLPAFRRSLQEASVSSYDRSGGNDDGFSGKYSFVRKEAGGLVIADLQGPGVIHRIWTPTPSDDVMEFYFDGEPTARLSLRFQDLFLGKKHPFLKPLVGHGVGGFFSYVPIAFARNCKIIVRAERVQFHQINYSLYPPETPVRTFQPKLAPDDEAHLAKGLEMLAAAGGDLASRTAPPGARLETLRRSVTLRPGGTATICDTAKSGRIVGFHLSPVAALESKARDVVLRISFDGRQPAVLCPVGDFFGFAWGEPAMQSLLVGASGDRAYCYFPMPFERSARVELVSEAAAGPALELQAEVVLAPVGRRPDEGYFHALWRRERPTTQGRPFTFIDARGRGHIVGVVLQAQGLESGKTLFFEGDDQAWIDGKLAIHGTGSEDFFNGGWYDVPDRWEKRLSFPFSGCLGYQKHLGRTGGYRLMLGEAYAFREHIRLTIEHSGTGNDIPTDYCAVTYLYADTLPDELLALPPAPARAVADPKEIVFPAWWQIPLRGWTFQNASLTRGRVKLGDEEVRFLSLKAEGQDWFGPPFLYLTVDLPRTAHYDIQLQAVKGPSQGRVQLFQDEVPVGESLDLYAEQPAKSGRVNLGTVRLQHGANPLMLKLVGKHERSTGLGLDLIEVICTQQE